MTAVDGPVDHGRGTATRFVTQLDAALAEPLSKARQAAFGAPRTCAWKAPGVRPWDSLKRRLR